MTPLGSLSVSSLILNVFSHFQAVAEFSRTCIPVPSDGTLLSQKQALVLTWTPPNYRARGNGSLHGFPDGFVLIEKALCVLL